MPTWCSSGTLPALPSSRKGQLIPAGITADTTSSCLWYHLEAKHRMARSALQAAPGTLEGAESRSRASSVVSQWICANCGYQQRWRYVHAPTASPGDLYHSCPTERSLLAWRYFDNCTSLSRAAKVTDPNMHTLWAGGKGKKKGKKNLLATRSATKSGRDEHSDLAEKY